MATYNDVTGDQISTRFGNKETQEKFNNNFDAIFGVKPKKEKYVPPPLPLNEYPEYSEDWQSESRDRAIAQNGNVGYSPSDME
jgi:hypothetical protein